MDKLGNFPKNDLLNRHNSCVLQKPHNYLGAAI